MDCKFLCWDTRDSARILTFAAICGQCHFRGQKTDASINLKFAKHGDFRYFNYVISKFTREIPNELNEYTVLERIILDTLRNRFLSHKELIQKKGDMLL